MEFCLHACILLNSSTIENRTVKEKNLTFNIHHHNIIEKSIHQIKYRMKCALWNIQKIVAISKIILFTEAHKMHYKHLTRS